MFLSAEGRELRNGRHEQSSLYEELEDWQSLYLK
jgi:hypothetical protein